jgi:hypothetical protein
LYQYFLALCLSKKPPGGADQSFNTYSACPDLQKSDFVKASV